MKKRFFSIAIVLFSFFAFAQKKENIQNWFHSSYEKTGVYGVGTNEALDFLKSKGLKPKTITVGVIDSGVQISHPDLKDNIWYNKNEIKGNSKDDDKNGYVDDVNGWNFIGNKNGENVNDDTLEVTRLVAKGKQLFEGDKNEINTKNIEKYPELYNEYKRAKLVYESKVKEQDMQNSAEDKELEYLDTLSKDLKKIFGEKPMLEQNILKSAKEISMDEKVFKEVTDNILNDERYKGKTVNEFIENLRKEIENFRNKSKNNSYKMDFNPRSIVGDNYDKLDEKGYGNNNVEGPDALHGTHVAGIIAAIKGNGIGMDGIAGDGFVKIMSVRAVPDGDERDKDIANAIFYAVDNGAKVINMSFGKPFSPDKEYVWKAIKYAESKDVLLVHAAGNDNKNIDVTYNYPTNYKESKDIPFVNNWITVGASTRYNDKLKASFSNYGRHVDIFAPGLEIYSTINNSGYEYLQGTSMASPIVSGCAAVLRAYFPKLTAIQVKEILMKTANVNKEPIIIDDDNEYTTFDKLSSSGGVVDLYKAVKYAYENYYNKK